MRLLLDTHTLLWWLTDSPKLSEKARTHIADPDNDSLVSAATGWECALRNDPSAAEMTGELAAWLVSDATEFETGALSD